MNNIPVMDHIEKNSRIIIFLFFAALLVTGVIVFTDYGISWDELVSRNNGLLAYKYVFEQDQELLSYRDRYYGTAFEMTLFMIEKALALKGPREIFFMRHLVTFLLFYAGVFFFYLLCKKRFNSWKMGLAGCFFLVLSPRIFAHSFYNSKDLAFLSVFLISIFTLIRYLEEKSLIWAFSHAVICAYLVGTRILGILVPVFTAAFFIADLFLEKEKRTLQAMTGFILYAVFLAFFTVLFWPILWVDPAGQFMTAFGQMSRFHFWSTVLYMGRYVEAKDLPWHYIPVWILVTTPVLFSVLFAGGLSVFARDFFKAPVRFYRSAKIDLLAVLWFLVPLFSVIFLRSVLYDGWRHMFFIYPAFLLLSLRGLEAFYGLSNRNLTGPLRRGVNVMLVCAVLFSVANTLRFMVAYHPYQNVYFNSLAGDMKNAKKNFEMDYWGLSYREALEYVVGENTKGQIKICVANPPGEVSALMLHERDRRRLLFTKDPAEAEYFLSNYRWHEKEYPYRDEYFSIKVGNARIMVVYDMTREEK